MFQFTNSPLLLLCIHNKILEVCSSRFPHSDIPGLTDICSSPRLFAAYHVLLRLSVPRHSPYALGRLTRNILLFNFQVSWWRWGDSNSWPPACKAGALPTELHPHLIWQPPALPHRLQCSTIGRLGLNRRVRDGNGCVPQPHRHQKCFSLIAKQ